MSRIVTLTLLAVLLLSIAASSADVTYLDALDITGDYLRIGAKIVPTGLPAEPSVWVFAADGSASWGAVSGYGGGGVWSRTAGIAPYLSPTTAGDRVYVQTANSFATITGYNSSGGDGAVGISETGSGVYATAGGSAAALKAWNSGTGGAIEAIAEATGSGVYTIAALPADTAKACARLGSYADFLNEAALADPASGDSRFGISGGVPHCKVNVGGTVTDYDLTDTGTPYTWTISDGSDTDLVSSGQTVSVLGSGGVSTLLTGTRELTIIGLDDHGALSGLGDDDHTQYALLAGRSGGQTLQGGTAAGDDLTLESTAHATKGTIEIAASNFFHFVGMALEPTVTSNPGGFWYSTASKNFRLNQGNTSDDVAYAAGLVGLLGAATSDVATTGGGSGSELAYGTRSITGSTNGTLGAETVLRVTAWGKVSTALSSPGTLTVRLRWGGTSGTQLCATAANTPASGLGNAGWRLDALITVRTVSTVSATVTQPNGQFRIQTSNSADAGWFMNSSSTVNVDNTSSKDLVLTAQWGTSSASNILTCQQFTVEVLN